MHLLYKEISDSPSKPFFLYDILKQQPGNEPSAETMHGSVN